MNPNALHGGGVLFFYRRVMENIEHLLGKIHQGDCLPFMRALPDKCVDLVLTDPPYGIGFGYNGYDDSIENFRKTVIEATKEIIRISKLAAIFTSHKNIGEFPAVDWIFSYTWDTTSSMCKYGVYQWQPVIIYGKDLPGFGSINGVLKSDTVRFSGDSNLKEWEKNGHPCPKPEKVMARFVKRLSNEGGVIFDPFLGSATTAIAAELLNRKWFGCELDPKYCAIAQARIDAERAQLKLF